MQDYEKNTLIIDEHEKRILKCENDLSLLDDKLNTQITEITELKGDLKSLCKSVDSLTGTIKSLCTISVTFLLGFFVYMLQTHFVIK